jgi:predicted nucleotidyltransferase
MIEFVQKTKEQAAQRFADELLRRCGEEVAEILLFGSVAEERPQSESDVDLLVFALGDVHSLREAATEIAFEVSLDTGESVEPVVLPLERRFERRSLFVHEVLNRGKVLYAMADEELQRAEWAGRLELARSYQRVAEYVFENGDYRQAADLAYNASELVAKTRARYDHGAVVEEAEARRLLDLIRKLLSAAAPESRPS